MNTLMLQVKGFSVTGSVVAHKKVLPGIPVFLDDVKVAVTDKDGKFQINRMDAGQHFLTAQSGTSLKVFGAKGTITSPLVDIIDRIRFSINTWDSRLG